MRIHWVLYDIHLITTQIRPGFYIYTLERSFCLILNIMIVIRHIPRCVIRLLLHSGLYYMCIHKAMISRPNTSRILHRVRGQRHVSQAALTSVSLSYIHKNVMATQIRPHPRVVQNTALTPPIRREPILYIECHTYNTHILIIDYLMQWPIYLHELCAFMWLSW